MSLNVVMRVQRGKADDVCEKIRLAAEKATGTDIASVQYRELGAWSRLWTLYVLRPLQCGRCWILGLRPLR